MIYIYTEQLDSGDWILQNDWYFNLYTGNGDFTREDQYWIEKVDHASLKEGKRIETRYGLGTIRNLSSGCKTLLNVIKNPQKVVNANECGKNVLDILFSMDNIHLYMSRPERIDMKQDIQICFNNTEIVLGKNGYENWWTREYERRASNDL